MPITADATTSDSISMNFLMARLLDGLETLRSTIRLAQFGDFVGHKRHHNLLRCEIVGTFHSFAKPVTARTGSPIIAGGRPLATSKFIRTRTIPSLLADDQER